MVYIVDSLSFPDSPCNVGKTFGQPKKYFMKTAESRFFQTGHPDFLQVGLFFLHVSGGALVLFPFSVKVIFRPAHSEKYPA